MRTRDDAPDATPERLQAVRALFERLLELAPQDVAPALERARAEDPVLAAEVEELLHAEAHGTSLFERPALERLHPGAGTPDAELEGRTLGAYRLLGKIGEGGMGEVYEAVRSDASYEKRVAVKVIRGSFVSRALAERFQQERQILAALDTHPGITRILDGGVTDDGSPYLVMDFVAGVPIDRYCRDNALGLEARLALFRDVCAAVQHAHRHLIVHRDIKPANILVTADGSVKLLDFGIAKILDAEAAPGAHVTGSQLVMTPDYASPEQILGRPVTTATDVYLLGVLLYELIAGQHPHRKSGSPTHETMRAVCEDEPGRPSSHVKGLDPDLDHIVLKALQKDPARRYASVEALLDDLLRYQERLPVLARRATTGYRLRRFVERHRLTVGAATLVVLALVAGLVAALWQARVAARQARRAEEVKRLLIDVFRQADAGQSSGHELSAREVIDLGAGRVAAELRDQPELRAEMLTLLGAVYTGLGAYDRAEPLLREAVGLRQAGNGGDAQLADSLDAYGVLLSAKGDLQQAERTLRQALALREAHGREGAAVVGVSLSHLADLMRSRAKYPEAEALFLRALEVQRRALGNDHREIANTLDGLAWTVRGAGDLKREETLAREALAMRRRLLGDEHPELMPSLTELAVNAFTRGDYAEAEGLYRRAIVLGDKSLSHDHPYNLEAMQGLGTVLLNEGREAEAEPILRETLSLAARRFGPRNPQLISILDSLARCLLIEGRADDSVRLYEQALGLAEEHFGPDHHEVAKSLHDLAGALGARGEWTRAEALYRRCLRILTALVGHDHFHVGRATASLAAAQLALGDVDGAAASYTEALRILRTKLPPGHELTASAALGLGRVRLRQGRRDEAEALVREAYDALLARFGAADSRTVGAALVLVESLDHADEGLAILRASRDALEATSHADDALVRRVADALQRLARQPSRPSGS